MFREPLIPGETPLEDLSGLRMREVTTKTQLNAVEAENIRKAISKYMVTVPTRALAPFDDAWMLRLHREMFGDVWTWAGVVRTTQTNIGSRPQDISVEVLNLSLDLRAWMRGKMPVLEQGVRLHHRAVLVHPFANGNGRWARLLANIWLRQNGGEVIEWPETTIGSMSVVREEYLAAIRAADAGDMDQLKQLHGRFGSRASDAPKLDL